VKFHESGAKTSHSLAKTFVGAAASPLYSAAISVESLRRAGAPVAKVVR
jgi:hypothetical protein